MKEVSASESARHVIFSRCRVIRQVWQSQRNFFSRERFVLGLCPRWADGSDDKQMHVRLGHFGLPAPDHLSRKKGP